MAGRTHRPAVIWVEITNFYCASGIDDWWEHEPVEDDFGDVQGREWLAFRRTLGRYRADAYEWKTDLAPRPYGHAHGGVYLRSLRTGADWLWCLGRLPDGVHTQWQETHPYVTFHYEEPDE